MTKKEKNMYERIINANTKDLNDLYIIFPFDYEMRNRIYKSLCKLDNGFNYRVINVIGRSFSAGYIYFRNGKKWCHYFTETNNYDFKVD